jgi:hypothetical protein
MQLKGGLTLLLTLGLMQVPLTGKAQTDEFVQLSGKLESSCSFTTVESGRLVFTPEESPSIISSKGSGSSALVNVNCNTPADLKVFDPKQTEGPEVPEKSSRAWLKFKGNQIHSDESKTLKIPPHRREVEIDLEVESRNPLKAGTYTYTVQITATP